MSLSYAVHAYAWTTSWSNDTLDLIDHSKELGFDLIEIPLMGIDKVDAVAIRARLADVGLRVCTSTAIGEDTDLTSAEPRIRQAGIDYLKRCVESSVGIGAESFSGVLYSAIGGRIDGMPDDTYWNRAAEGLREIALFAGDAGLTIGIEPINRYETFLVNTCEQALKLIKLIDQPNVGVHLDTYHMNIEEEDFYNPTMAAKGKLCHYHLSESHRGTPGTGTVNWREVYTALAKQKYAGVVGLESFNNVSDAMRAATCVWREIAPSSDHLLSHGLSYLKQLEKEVFA